MFSESVRRADGAHSQSRYRIQKLSGASRSCWEHGNARALVRALACPAVRAALAGLASLKKHYNMMFVVSVSFLRATAKSDNPRPRKVRTFCWPCVFCAYVTMSPSVTLVARSGPQHLKSLRRRCFYFRGVRHLRIAKLKDDATFVAASGQEVSSVSCKFPRTNLQLIVRATHSSLAYNSGTCRTNGREKCTLPVPPAK